MTREAIGALLLLLGSVIVRLVIAGDHLVFVKESLTIPLVLSAALLLTLGLLELRTTASEKRAAAPIADAHDHDDDGHGHHHVGAGPRMGMFLLAPVAVLLLVPATPLGAFAAGNGAANAVGDISFFGEMPAPDADGVVELTVPDLVGRAVLEPDPVVDVPVRTLGFVVPDPDAPGTYLLSRFTVGCCAVDAAPYQVRVEVGGAEVPAEEQWVEAVVVYEGDLVEEDGAEPLPVVTLVSQELVPEPEVPYVY